jgi:SAM-dependent methyltransferase
MSGDARKQMKLFGRNLPMCVRLQEVLRALGNTSGQTCLQIGAENGPFSYLLRRTGGQWQSVVSSEESAEEVRSFVPENVHVSSNGELPFKKMTFDVVVVIDHLHTEDSDDAFVAECHRVMKQDARLVVNTARFKSWSLVRSLRRLLGLSQDKRDVLFLGYSEGELFQLLKHGFDVQTTRTYSRSCVEFTDVIVACIGRHLRKSDAPEKLMRLYAIAKPIYWVCDQVDMLLFFTKGYNLIASAKQRTWRERETPVLIDGRAISEVVLSPLK